MNKKILYIASATSHIANFHSEYIKSLQESGFEVHTAAGRSYPETDSEINSNQNFILKFEKNKNLLKNIAVIFALSKLIKREKYHIISTHATLAGFAGRLAVFFNKNLKVFHTCHGYLFNDDGSLKSRIMILLEKFLSRRTDILFVMNCDDYNIAEKYKLCRNIKYINGMGLNPAKLLAKLSGFIVPALNIFEKYKIPENKKYFLCIGEFSKRKSQRDIIYALKSIKDLKNLHVIFLGGGVLLEECKKLCESLEIQDSVTFCGHAGETSAFYKLADCVISASRFEGMPFNILEALYFNKPVIASNVKGHKDLLKDDFNGSLFDYGDCGQLAGMIQKILIDKNYDNLKNNAFLEEKYLLENVKQEILEEILKGIISSI